MKIYFRGGMEMKNLVVYDSVFGNTGKVARAICETIDARDEAECLQVKKVKYEELKDVDLLIVGSPTRKFSPTGAIKKFLKKLLSDDLEGVDVAAFDTRISLEDTNSWFLNFLVKLFGYAAKPIARKLEKKSGNLIVEPEGFIVTGTEGPLKNGELDRARKWANKIVNLSQKK